MNGKIDLTVPTRVGEWLREMGFSPVTRADPKANWLFEVTYPPGHIRVGVGNPKAMPRSVTIACRLTATTEQVAAFRNLEEDSKREFWQTLRATLNREFVEFQIEGMRLSDCPIAFQVTAIRFDDGLSLDSLARTMSSVNKACIDACAIFEERLGSAGPASGGEFEFKRLGVQ